MKLERNNQARFNLASINGQMRKAITKGQRNVNQIAPNSPTSGRNKYTKQFSRRAKRQLISVFAGNQAYIYTWRPF